MESRRGYGFAFKIEHREKQESSLRGENPAAALLFYIPIPNILETYEKQIDIFCAF